MIQRKMLILMLVTLVIGFGGGFLLRPVIMPQGDTTGAVTPITPAASLPAPRSKQYFEANIEEARHVIDACRKGTAQGDECTNAETAIVTVESKARFKRFRDQR